MRALWLQNMKKPAQSQQANRWQSRALRSKSRWASLVAQVVKNAHAVQESWIRSLGWENPLEKGTATHSSILAWRIPWTE